MKCVFCHNQLVRVAHGGSDKFDLIICRGCQSPQYYTLYRELYFTGSKVKLYDQVQLDEFIVTRYHQPDGTGRQTNFSLFYRESLGVIDNSTDFTPVSITPVVCRINHVVELSFADLGSLKRKLKLWTTFS